MKNYILFLIFTSINYYSLFSQINPYIEHELTNIYGVHQGMINSVLVQNDGKILSAGWSEGSSNAELLVLRYNQNGTLDSNFGLKGVVLTEVIGLDAKGFCIAIQADQKILLIGTLNEKYNPFGFSIVLIRYNTDGSIDNTFGTNGRVFVEPINYENYGHPSIDLQDDGKIVASVGMKNRLDRAFVLFRFNSDGSLDNSFGDNGKVKKEVNNDGDAYSVKLQSDGKIVVSGQASVDGAVARFNTNGEIDNTFGNNGFVVAYAFGSNLGTSLNIQTDGKIVHVGSQTDTINWWSNYGVIRYNTDGTLDNTFGVGGFAITGVTGKNLRARCSTIQADGKILVAGSTKIDRNKTKYNSPVTYLVRYNPNGSLDSTFGMNGILKTDSLSYNDVPNSIEVQSDGKIMLGGYIINEDYPHDPQNNMNMRLYTDGSIDSSFNLTGMAITEKNSVDIANSIFIGPDSSVTVSGSADSTLTMVRYNSDGSLNEVFGGNGKVITSTKGTNSCVRYHPENKILLISDSCLSLFNSDGSSDTSFATNGLLNLNHVIIQEAIVQSDGKIIVSGYTTLPDNKFTLHKYNIDGSPDLLFGTEGQIVTDFGNYGDYGYTCIIQQDGKIILAGNTKISGSGSQPINKDFAIARYNEDGSLDDSFGINGKVTTTLSNYTDHCNSVAIQTDGKIICTGQSDNSFVLLRYKSNGILDTSFNSNGIIISPLIGRFGNKVLIDTLGKIITLVDSNRLIRFNSNGELDESYPIIELINDPGINEGLFDAVYEPDGKITLTGSYQNDFLTMKIYSELYTKIDFVEDNPIEFSLYPNPTNGVLKINYKLSKSENISLILYNNDGKIIKCFKMNEYCPSGFYDEVYTIGNQIPAGIYFLEIRTQTTSKCIKVIKK